MEIDSRGKEGGIRGGPLEKIADGNTGKRSRTDTQGGISERQPSDMLHRKKRDWSGTEGAA